MIFKEKNKSLKEMIKRAKQRSPNSFLTPQTYEWRSPSHLSFNDEINAFSSIIDNFSPLNLGLLVAPLKETIEEKYNTTDKEFLNQFPVEEIRTKRWHVILATTTASEALDIFNVMKHSDYWKLSSKIERKSGRVNCLGFHRPIFCFEEDVPEFKHQIFSVFSSTQYIKDKETRLVIQVWLEYHQKIELVESERGDYQISQRNSKQNILVLLISTTMTSSAR